jgi:hypothetical protein
LDWLNRITDEHFQFFGLEVELWRIGDSPAAPKFNIVSKPNDWSQSVARGARAIVEGELSETRQMQRNYWEALMGVLKAVGGPVSGNRKPQPQSWMSFPIGRSRFHLNAVMTRTKRQVRVELYILGDSAKAILAHLRQQKESVEQDLGCELEWNDLSGRDQAVILRLNNVDPEDESDWQRQHTWLAKRLNDFHRVFARRVGDLDLTALQDPAE